MSNWVWNYVPAGELEIGQKPISKPKSEISNWTRIRVGVGLDCPQALAVQSEISDFGFEMGFCPISNL